MFAGSLCVKSIMLPDIAKDSSAVRGVWILEVERADKNGVFLLIVYE